jgi:hypothetical protein
MPRSALQGRRIAVERRANGCFAGSVPVIMPSHDQWVENLRGPWKLEAETKEGLGLPSYGKSISLHLCPVCRSLFIAYYSTHHPLCQ